MHPYPESMSKANLTSVLEAFGASRESVLLLDKGRSDPRQLPYLDILRLNGTNGIDGVVELGGRSILYVVGGAPDQQQLPSLHRIVAYRADTPFLAFVEPGRLTLYDLGQARARPVREITDHDPESRTFVPSLGLRPEIDARRKYSADLILSLLESTTEKISKSGLSADDALSLSGRALFLRFLVDREIVKPEDLTEVCQGASEYAECFSTPARAQATSSWLDDTFNGHLLPLSFGTSGLAHRLGQLSERNRSDVLNQLSLIAHRAHPSGQLMFNWGDIDFGHVPVGLLSQVYESHCAKYDAASRSKSVYYTPRQLAEYVVTEAFNGLTQPWAATVLDPAAGAGVFLVAAFRRLVAAHWEHYGKPPTSTEIRRILYEQLSGFDVNATALRLTALSLYLTALEVDVKPRPLSKLGFKELLGTVLFNFEQDALGSLQHGADAAFLARFDVVLGNPPWTVTKRTAARRKALLEAVRMPIGERLGVDVARSAGLPDDNPDLAFLLVAMRWAKPSGRIAFLMHARLLFKQSEPGQLARSLVFRALRVSSILNGAALRHTSVWPRVSAPFCFILAENTTPGAADEFTYASPLIDDALNSLGSFRIDYSAAQPIWHGAVTENRFLFKILFRGSALDVPVLRQIESRGRPLVAVWEGLNLEYGDGFQVGGSARKHQSAEALHGLPTLASRKDLAPLIEARKLPVFTAQRVLYPRSREIYRAPLVLCPVAPRAQENSRWAFLSFRDVAFNESFYGLSTHGHAEAEKLARYLHLVLSSDLLLYYVLLTSSKLGVEREEITKEDLDRLPIVPLESLSLSHRDKIDSLSKAFCAAPSETRAAVNSFVMACYKLGDADRQVIRDTLAANLPFKQNKTWGQRPTTDAVLKKFFAEFNAELRLLRDDDSLQASLMSAKDSWIWFTIGGAGKNSTGASVALDAHVLAEAFGSSQIVVLDTGGERITIAMINQMRYLTPTRGRLCARRISEDFGRYLQQVVHV
jgi:N-6 DNA Methylase